MLYQRFVQDVVLVSETGIQLLWYFVCNDVGSIRLKDLGSI